VRELGLSAVVVTHDLAVVRLLADRLMVMKDGRVVEQGLTDQVLDDPQHGYTQLLVSSVLQSEARAARAPTHPPTRAGSVRVRFDGRR
jgi:ABC-type phosphonate transport system, ATPase component